jgi:membrane protease YdiL (CAAX protease family)
MTPIHPSAHDSPFSAASVVLSAILVAPWIEEAYFRGFLLPSLCGWTGRPGAILVQSLFFAALHVPDSEAAFLQYAVQGAVYGAVATASQGKLTVPISVHSAYNALALTSIALLDSGVTS